ncbi:hypothetical protein [Nocardia sp. NPDC050175]|uniref:hypothetical protein n=1 Tax=Nocardia sp. NPDC050175 TaxID=3364317 RepID=UPI0037B0EC74
MGKHSAPSKNQIPARLAILSTATLIGLGVSAHSGAGQAVAETTTVADQSDHVAPAPAKAKRVLAANGQGHHSRNVAPPKKKKPGAKPKAKPAADKPAADPLELLNSGSATLAGLAKSLNTGSAAITPLAKALSTGSTAVSGSAATGSKAAGGLAPLLGLLSGSAL